MASLLISEGAIEKTMANQEAMTKALQGLISTAKHDGAKAILIGGGPLARAAEALAGHCDIPIIEPISAGARAVARLLG